jgi:hypothetical protein
VNPRDRIASHLRRILVAAGMALPSAGHGDTSTPKPPGTPDDGKKPNQGGDKKKEPEHLGYEVVDMMPPPYIEREEAGKLELASTPTGAAISIDGVSLRKKTPLKGHKLAAGQHAVTLTSPDGKTVRNFIVTVQKDQTTRARFSLAPAPSPSPEPAKK